MLPPVKHAIMTDIDGTLAIANNRRYSESSMPLQIFQISSFETYSTISFEAVVNLLLS